MLLSKRHEDERQAKPTQPNPPVVAISTGSDRLEVVRELAGLPGSASEGGREDGLADLCVCPKDLVAAQVAEEHGGGKKGGWNGWMDGMEKRKKKEKGKRQSSHE